MRHYFAHVVRSKGLANVLPRALAIGRNFGLTEARIERKLAALGDLTARHGAPLTACITACLIERYPRAVEAMRRRGWEIAVHGRVHCDLRQLGPERQAAEMVEALRLCRRRGVPTAGFRAPYLAWDEGTRQAAARAGFLWTSNQALMWPVLEKSEHSGRDWEALGLVLEHLYRPRLAERVVSVPRICQGVVEIPVSLPDDEILLDRLHASEAQVERLWLRLFEESRRRGEMAVLLFHHERVPAFARPLSALLHSAAGPGAAVWLADLGQLARWWRERAGFSFEVGGAPGRWEVRVKCSPAGAVLLAGGGSRQWPLPGWREVEERRFTLTAQARPTVGVGPGVPPEAVAFLRNEGFLVEPRRGEHALLLAGGPRGFCPGGERELLEAAEGAPWPLVRFWRWPRGFASALALSMDVDSMTLLDFAKRPLQR